ncbi:MAG: 23S rRNA (pseudouridine(1915)-N(3))-methyltransferase RlmH [Lachnospiraceae bacterium]|nr:23S rRNA (pseudouridine(1915)-N(3))-methyltransferase RlmH [Lachnospiraceae bacterium]
MVKITIICVGKIKEKYLKDAVNEYSKRLSAFCRLEIKEVADEKTKENLSAAEENIIKKREGEKIISLIKDRQYVITLEIEGRMLDSPELSKRIDSLLSGGNSDICFVIGGSLGLSDEIKERADLHLSFSKLTFPHQLMRVILLEQIYRSFKIMSGEPYHK